jgi:hypothetical protein
MPLSSRGILQCLYENLEVNAFENAKRVASKLSATPHTHTQRTVSCAVSNDGLRESLRGIRKKPNFLGKI